MKHDMRPMKISVAALLVALALGTSFPHLPAVPGAAAASIPEKIRAVATAYDVAAPKVYLDGDPAEPHGRQTRHADTQHGQHEGWSCTPGAAGDDSQECALRGAWAGKASALVEEATRAVHHLLSVQQAEPEDLHLQAYQQAVTLVHGADAYLNDLPAPGNGAQPDADLQQAEELLAEAEEHLKEAAGYQYRGAQRTAMQELQGVLQALDDAHRHLQSSSPASDTAAHQVASVWLPGLIAGLHKGAQALGAWATQLHNLEVVPPAAASKRAPPADDERYARSVQLLHGVHEAVRSLEQLESADPSATTTAAQEALDHARQAFDAALQHMTAWQACSQELHTTPNTTWLGSRLRKGVQSARNLVSSVCAAVAHLAGSTAPLVHPSTWTGQHHHHEHQQQQAAAMVATSQPTGAAEAHPAGPAAQADVVASLGGRGGGKGTAIEWPAADRWQQAQQEAHQAGEELNTAGELAVEAAQHAAAGAVLGGMSAVHATQHAAGSAVHATQHAAGSAVHATQHATGAAVHAVQHAAGEAMHATQHAAAEVAGKVERVGHGLQHAAGDAAHRAKAAVEGTTEALGHAAVHTAEVTREGLAHVGNAAAHAAGTARDAAVHAAGSARDAAAHAAGTAHDATAHAAAAARDAAAHAAGAAREAVGGAADAVRDAAGHAAHGVRDAAKAARDTAVHAAGTANEAVTHAATAAREQAARAADATGRTAAEAKERAEHWASDVAGAAQQVTSDAAHRVQHGAEQTAAAARHAAHSVHEHACDLADAACLRAAAARDGAAHLAGKAQRKAADKLHHAKDWAADKAAAARHAASDAARSVQQGAEHAAAAAGYAAGCVKDHVRELGHEGAVRAAAARERAAHLAGTAEHKAADALHGAEHVAGDAAAAVHDAGVDAAHALQRGVEQAAAAAAHAAQSLQQRTLELTRQAAEQLQTGMHAASASVQHGVHSVAQQAGHMGHAAQQAVGGLVSKQHMQDLGHDVGAALGDVAQTGRQDAPVDMQAAAWPADQQDLHDSVMAGACQAIHAVAGLHGGVRQQLHLQPQQAPEGAVPPPSPAAWAEEELGTCAALNKQPTRLPRFVRMVDRWLAPVRILEMWLGLRPAPVPTHKPPAAQQQLERDTAAYPLHAAGQGRPPTGPLPHQQVSGLAWLPPSVQVLLGVCPSSVARPRARPAGSWQGATSSRGAGMEKPQPAALVDELADQQLHDMHEQVVAVIAATQRYLRERGFKDTAQDSAVMSLPEPAEEEATQQGTRDHRHHAGLEVLRRAVHTASSLQQQVATASSEALQGALQEGLQGGKMLLHELRENVQQAAQQGADAVEHVLHAAANGLSGLKHAAEHTAATVTHAVAGAVGPHGREGGEAAGADGHWHAAEAVPS